MCLVLYLCLDRLLNGTSLQRWLIIDNLCQSARTIVMWTEHGYIHLFLYLNQLVANSVKIWQYWLRPCIVYLLNRVVYWMTQSHAQPNLSLLGTRKSCLQLSGSLCLSCNGIVLFTLVFILLLVLVRDCR